MKNIAILALIVACAFIQLSATEVTTSHPMIEEAEDFALEAKPNNLTAIDLGTGTGRNIAALLEKGATVYAYDASPESVKLLQERFSPYIKDKKLYVYQKYFEDIDSLPQADLIIAWRSLSFMKKNRFLAFWKELENALIPNGIFTGTFFGKNHYVLVPPEELPIVRLTQEEVLKLFINFQILHFQEELQYEAKASKPSDRDQFEHIYRIIAKKK